MIEVDFNLNCIILVDMLEVDFNLDCIILEDTLEEGT
jgi:hypothetical protein